MFEQLEQGYNQDQIIRLQLICNIIQISPENDASTSYSFIKCKIRFIKETKE